MYMYKFAIAPVNPLPIEETMRKDIVVQCLT